MAFLWEIGSDLGLGSTIDAVSATKGKSFMLTTPTRSALFVGFCAVIATLVLGFLGIASVSSRERSDI
jgi:hypothetical protein